MNCKGSNIVDSPADIDFPLVKLNIKLFIFNSTVIKSMRSRALG